MNASAVESSYEKVYTLAHQNVCILNIDFHLKRISGFTELLFIPLRLTKVTTVKLNAKQCQIVKLLAKGSTNYYSCDFTFNDPLLEVVPIEPPVIKEGEIQPVAASEKTLRKFSSKHQEAVCCTETDIGNGEVIIQLPEEVKKEISDGSTFKIFIEYIIDQPQGGLQFVTPEEEAPDTHSNVINIENIEELKTAHDDNPVVEETAENAPASTPTAATAPSLVESGGDATPRSPVTSPQQDQSHVVPMETVDTPTETPTPSRTPTINMNGHSPHGLEDSPMSKEESDISEQPVGKQNQDPAPTSYQLSPNPLDTKSSAQDSIEQPPKTAKSRFAHLFTYKNHNSSRLWFPCLDSYGQPCTWLLEFTVESHLSVISCGDLIGTHSTKDRRFKTFRYELNVPTAAPNIGFAAGQFDAWINPVSATTNLPIKNYFLHGLNRLLPASCEFLNDCAEFYEDFLTFKYPYTNYKQIFVDHAYELCQSYATMSICDTNLLHSKRIIDQAFTTRSVLADALAAQYFGCFISMSSWSAAWLTRGVSHFIASQYRRKIFGNNEYRFNVQETMKKLIDYEQKYGGIVLDQSSTHVNKSKSAFHFSTQSPHTISPLYDEAHRLKSFLVIRMLEDRIGKTLLIQVFNKILSLASNASQQSANMKVWGNMLLSTVSFNRAVFTVTGLDKEIASFLEQWVYQGGHAKFNGSYSFDRKRNVVELKIKQVDTGSTGVRPYFGAVTVTVQELDGTFPHKLNIEENKTTPFVITCHSKSRRNKKKKIPLCTGEEVDMDLSLMANSESPVLWIRIDPDMQILRQIVFEQPDYNWQYQLKYERDVTAQMDSLQVLMNHKTVATRNTLMEITEDERCFYKIRCTAALNLADIASDTAITTTSGSCQAPTNLINIYKRLFGSHSCPHIVRLNNFSLTNLQSYFLQKTIPKALAKLRVPPYKMCPNEVLKFLLDLFKYNDNSKNSFSDNYYRASLIEALAGTVAPIMVPLFNNTMQTITLDQVPNETKLIAEEITRCLNLEKILPCYRYVVTVACLKAIHLLQHNGYLPSNPGLFRSYTRPDVFIDIRCAAVVHLVDIIRETSSLADLEFLLDLVEKDRVPTFRYFILAQLLKNPPLSIYNFVNYHRVRERLWVMMNTGFAHDSKLRSATADVFHKFFGKSDKSNLSSGLTGDLNHKSKKKKKKKDKDKDKKKSKKTKENHKLFLSSVTQ